MTPDVQLEALLFYRATAVRKADAAAALGLDQTEIGQVVETLRERLSGRALTVTETAAEVQLTTTAAVAPLIDAIRKDELRTEIGKAGAETLAIILYKEPISRAAIDQIRGVNSSVTLRNLMTRGLITRNAQKGSTGAVFSVTPQLLAYLGIERKQDLPEYGAILDRIETFEQTTGATNE